MFKILYVCSLKADLYRDQRFIEEFRQFPDVELIVCKGSALMNICKLKKLLPEADAVITMYGNKQIKEFMKAQTVKSFNKVEPSFIANNKWATYQKLSAANIPQPKTSLQPIFDFPYICKANFGSLGNDIKLITSMENSAPVEVAHIFQEYIAESAGTSARVIMVNKKPVAWYALRNDKNFRSNFAKGGVGHKCELTPEMEDLCIRTAECLDLDYCGIDLLHSNRGWLVLEVNSKAGLEGIETFTGLNIAKHFAEYVVETLRLEKAMEKTND